MTPAKRRPATPASQGPTRSAPDVPKVANPPPVRAAKTKDDTQLLGPEGEPVAQGAATGEAGRDPAPPKQAGQVNREAQPTQSRRRPAGLYPLPVWPD
jgi:hypothetical protein